MSEYSFSSTKLSTVNVGIAWAARHTSYLICASVPSTTRFKTNCLIDRYSRKPTRTTNFLSGTHRLLMTEFRTIPANLWEGKKPEAAKKQETLYLPSPCPSHLSHLFHPSNSNPFRLFPCLSPIRLFCHYPWSPWRLPFRRLYPRSGHITELASPHIS